MTKALPRSELGASALAVRQAIGRAASRTGVDFGYLLNQAKSESGLDPTAQAGNSSAAGLYQFIDQSWLGVVRQHGGEHGYGWAADAVERSGGRWVVRDPALRDAVFALRKDPEASALMAAESAGDNKDRLSQALGREVGAADLYMAHFLGPARAERFLKAADARPDASAAALFPHEAHANRAIFYGKGGAARSLGEVYALMARKIGGPVDAGDLPDDAGATLMADGKPLSATPPGVQLASLDGDAASPLDQLQSTAEARAHGDLLRPQPQQARLAYLMVLSSLDLA